MQPSPGTACRAFPERGEHFSPLQLGAVELLRKFAILGLHAYCRERAHIGAIHALMANLGHVFDKDDQTRERET